MADESGLVARDAILGFESHGNLSTSGKPDIPGTYNGLWGSVSWTSSDLSIIPSTWTEGDRLLSSDLDLQWSPDSNSASGYLLGDGFEVKLDSIIYPYQDNQTAAPYTYRIITNGTAIEWVDVTFKPDSVGFPATCNVTASGSIGAAKLPRDPRGYTISTSCTMFEDLSLKFTQGALE